MTTTNSRNWYTETRYTADRSRPGSRWERTGASVDEVTARAQYEEIALRPGVDVRLCRLDWLDDSLDNEEAMPLTTVVLEAAGAA